MTSTNHKIFILLALLISELSLAAGLSGLPPGYPKQFDSYGIVDDIDLQGRTVIIADQLMALSDDSVILSPNRGEVPLASLQRKQLVGFEISDYGIGRGAVLRRAWIMPSHVTLEKMHNAQQED